MERRAIVVQGIVQGVGFRPFVYNLATRLGLAGFVKNQTGSVVIEVEGDGVSLDRFMNDLRDHPPPLSQIESIACDPCLPRGERLFRVASSDNDAAGPIFISPDVAVCAECLRELFDPKDRRYRYPFLNCTNCGPRLTIIQGAPYDRPRTTMAEFPMCSACRAEYDNPADRRFHAQPTACPVCGPRLRALDALGAEIELGDPLATFVDLLKAGKIGALKGLGGYHLVCAANDAAAVAELRRRKHREEKPFAVMVRDIAGAERLAEIGDNERKLLRSPRAPIVLLRKRAAAPLADAIAPGNPHLGVMLPYTPLHHLLMHAMDGAPLVMTSGNRSNEPIAYRDEEVMGQLAGIADFFLIHNRPIHVRCDDSVTRIVSGEELPVRRSRGYAPRPIDLTMECRVPLLAVGGQLKGTFALGQGRRALLSHHLGDLDHFEAFRAFQKDVVLYQELFDIEPECLVHDAHPDYATTVYAQKRARETGKRLLAVQHHHAHVAGCMAEHGLRGPVLGVAFDGTGFGEDGTIWGGEFLIADYADFRRAAHLRYVAMPGGDRAIREPWRMAFAHALDAGIESASLKSRIAPLELRTVERMLKQRLNAPLTSSMGRLFDAVASLAGIRDRVSHEGQAAIEMEWLATQTAADGVYPFDLEASSEHSLVVDTRPLVLTVVEDERNRVAPARIARRFHSTMTEIVARTCARLRDASGIETVVLSGGVFLNALLTHEVGDRLRGEGFQVYRHCSVPPNDGGLSLGQLAIAAAKLSAEVRTNDE